MDTPGIPTGPVPAEGHDPTTAGLIFRRNRRTHIIDLIVCLLLLPLPFAFAVLLLIRAAHTGAWYVLWLTTPLMLPAAFFPLLIYSREAYSLRVEAALWALRRAAAAGDDQIAPLAAEQPVWPPDEQLSAKAQRPGVMRRLDDPHPSRVRLIFSPLMLALPWLYLIFPAAIIFSGKIRLSNITIGPVPFFPALFAALVFQWYLTFIFTVAQAGKPVRIDEDGLHLRPFLWRRRGEDIPWSRVRSFVRLEFRVSYLTRPQPAYILDAGDAVFTFGNSLYARAGAYLDTLYLNHLTGFVANRTGLPLRDGTAAAFMVARLVGGRVGALNARRLTRRLALQGKPPTPGEALARWGITPTTAADRRHARRWRWLSWAPVLAAAALYLTGLIAQIVLSRP